MHRSIERHQTLAIMFTLLVSGLAGWRAWKRGPLSSGAFKRYVAISVVGTIGILWTAKVGGRIMFQHAGGIETRILESSLAERTAGHAHAADTPADHEHPADTPEEHEHATDSTSANPAGN